MKEPKEPDQKSGQLSPGIAKTKDRSPKLQSAAKTISKKCNGPFTLRHSL
jgi:hypothetical protein